MTASSSELIKKRVFVCLCEVFLQPGSKAPAGMQLVTQGIMIWGGGRRWGVGVVWSNQKFRGNYTQQVKKQWILTSILKPRWY